jgi:hypothetical protein
MNQVELKEMNFVVKESQHELMVSDAERCTFRRDELKMEYDGSVVSVPGDMSLALAGLVDESAYTSFVRDLNVILGEHYAAMRVMRRELSALLAKMIVAGCATRAISNFYFVPRYRKLMRAFKEAERDFIVQLRDWILRNNTVRLLPLVQMTVTVDNVPVSASRGRGHTADLISRVHLWIESRSSAFQ